MRIIIQTDGGETVKTIEDISFGSFRSGDYQQIIRRALVDAKRREVRQEHEQEQIERLRAKIEAFKGVSHELIIFGDDLDTFPAVWTVKETEVLNDMIEFAFGRFTGATHIDVYEKIGESDTSFVCSWPRPNDEVSK